MNQEPTEILDDWKEIRTRAAKRKDMYIVLLVGVVEACFIFGLPYLIKFFTAIPIGKQLWSHLQKCI